MEIAIHFSVKISFISYSDIINSQQVCFILLIVDTEGGLLGPLKYEYDRIFEVKIKEETSFTYSFG